MQPLGHAVCSVQPRAQDWCGIQPLATLRLDKPGGLDHSDLNAEEYSNIGTEDTSFDIENNKWHMGGSWLPCHCILIINVWRNFPA